MLICSLGSTSGGEDILLFLYTIFLWQTRSQCHISYANHRCFSGWQYSAISSTTNWFLSYLQNVNNMFKWEMLLVFLCCWKIQLRLLEGEVWKWVCLKVFLTKMNCHYCNISSSNVWIIYWRFECLLFCSFSTCRRLGSQMAGMHTVF